MANQITPNPSVPSQVVAEVKFPKFINNLGIIPTSYKDSMSYYECLAWLCKFLEETVIPTVNENGEAVEELQNLYTELNSYVTNYFSTLDVQEEINNKLDDMVEAGTLQEIIADYLNSKAVFGYNTVTDMKNATNLINGSYAKTLGFYEINDGGSSLYKIRNITNEDVVDEMFIISLSDSENLIAELIPEDNTISIKQIGGIGDGETNEFTRLQSALDSDYNLIIDNTYLTSNSLELTKRKNITGNGTLKATQTMTYVLYINFEYAEHYNKFQLNIDCNSLANTIGLCVSGCSRNDFNINIYNCAYIGVYPRYDDSSMSSNKWSISGYNNDNFTNSVLLNGGQDEIFESIYSKNFKITVNISKGGNTYKLIHCWTSSDSIFEDSIAINMLAANYENSINTLIWDTVETCFNCNSFNTGIPVTNIIYEFNTNLVTSSNGYLIKNPGSICKINFGYVDYNMTSKLLDGTVTISAKQLYESIVSDARKESYFNDSSKTLSDVLKLTTSNTIRLSNLSNSDWVESTFDTSAVWLVQRSLSMNGFVVNIYKYNSSWNLLNIWTVPFNNQGNRTGSYKKIFEADITGSIGSNTSVSIELDTSSLYQVFIHRSGNITPAYYIIQNNKVGQIIDTDSTCSIAYDTVSGKYVFTNNKGYGINYIIRKTS